MIYKEAYKGDDALAESGDIIYIDILLSINLAVNYFLLLSALKFTGRRPKRQRILLSAFVGAFYSLIILLPSFPWPLQFLTRSLCCFVMILLCEWPLSKKELFQDCFIFFIISFVFAGFILSIKILFSPSSLLYANGSFYLDITAPTLIFSALTAYIITELFHRLFRKKNSTTVFGISEHIELSISFDGHLVKTTGFIDTGNTLLDPLSGTPVVIIGFDVAQKLLSHEKISALSSPLTHAGELGAGTVSGFRLIPYHTISGSGLLPVFRPEKFTLHTVNYNYSSDDVLIGFSLQNELCGEHPVIINPELLLRQINKKKKTKQRSLHSDDALHN